MEYSENTFETAVATGTGERPLAMDKNTLGHEVCSVGCVPNVEGTGGGRGFEGVGLIIGCCAERAEIVEVNRFLNGDSDQRMRKICYQEGAHSSRAFDTRNC